MSIRSVKSASPFAVKARKYAEGGEVEADDEEERGGTKGERRERGGVEKLRTPDVDVRRAVAAQFSGRAPNGGVFSVDLDDATFRALLSQMGKYREAGIGFDVPLGAGNLSLDATYGRGYGSAKGGRPDVGARAEYTLNFAQGGGFIRDPETGRYYDPVTGRFLDDRGVPQSASGNYSNPYMGWGQQRGGWNTGLQPQPLVPVQSDASRFTPELSKYVPMDPTKASDAAVGAFKQEGRQLVPDSPLFTETYRSTDGEGAGSQPLYKTVAEWWRNSPGAKREAADAKQRDGMRALAERDAVESTYGIASLPSVTGAAAAQTGGIVPTDPTAAPAQPAPIEGTPMPDTPMPPRRPDPSEANARPEAATPEPQPRPTADSAAGKVAAAIASPDKPAATEDDKKGIAGLMSDGRGWDALMMLGLGMAASKNPDWAAAMAEGGIGAMNYLQSRRKEDRENRRLDIQDRRADAMLKINEAELGMKGPYYAALARKAIADADNPGGSARSAEVARLNYLADLQEKAEGGDERAKRLLEMATGRRGEEAIQRQNIMATATKLVEANPKLSMNDALKQVEDYFYRGRQSASPQPSTSAPTGGTSVQIGQMARDKNGNTVRWDGTSWIPVR